MARPKKKGLDYYPMDVNFWDDYKIIDLLSMYGPLGVSVYIGVISEVYKNGYYLEIPKEMLAVQMIRKIGSRWIKNKDTVIKVIEYCAEIGLLDNALLEQSVITSRAIQTRYSEVTARSKAVKEKYWLLEKEAPTEEYEADPSEQKEVFDTEIEVFDEETEVYNDFIPQSKVNKRKENENKSNESKVCHGIVIPCKNGEFIVDDKLMEELSHTYPEMDVEKSLKKLSSYVRTNPKKQGYYKGVRPYIDLWLAEDDYSGKYRKSKDVDYDEIFPAIDPLEYIDSDE